jgi:DNA primase
MDGVEINKPYTFKCDGDKLARVLLYYSLIPDNNKSEYKVVCPFHDDENPSMKVNLNEGSYYCFGCEASGDCLTFIEHLNNMDSFEAVKKLFKIINSSKTKTIRKKYYKGKEKQNTDLYYGLKKTNWLTDKDVEVLKVKEYMCNRGYKAYTLNFMQAKYNYDKNYPLIFPIMDNDVFRGWVCRTTDKAVEKKRKYLYNEGFSRATTLCGEYGKKDYIIVVEGYMDRLRFVQNGINNVVAILGWKMSKEQEKKIKDAGIKYIISALDNDPCGRKGTEYLRTIFPSVIRFCFYKSTKDAGEMSDYQFKLAYNKTMGKLKSYRNLNKEKENTGRK